MLTRALLLILIVGWVTKANAAALKEYWTSARALGMGNAYTSVVDDSDAIFLNPAVMARMSGVRWTALDTRVGANRADFYQEYQDFRGLGSPSEVADFVSTRYGDQYWATGGAKTALTIPYIGLAAYANSEISLLPNNPANPLIDLDYYADYGFVMAGGFDIIPSVFSFGLTGKRITRVGTALPIGGAILADLDHDDLARELKNRGSGYGLDAGFLITAPTPVKPSVALVYRNIGYTTFNHEGGARAPARIAPELVFSTSLKIDAPLITVTPAFEYKHIDDSTTQFAKKIHLGVEVSIPLIDIRAGLNQGYYTAGAGLDLGVMRFDVATYGVELGEYPGQHEDRRYMAQATFDIGFEMSSFSGKDAKTGKRARLKQRR